MEENKAVIEGIQAYRNEYGTDSKPFQIHAGVMDSTDVDSMMAMEAIGATHIFTAPWDVYNPALSQQEKVDAVKRFGDTVIAKYN